MKKITSTLLVIALMVISLQTQKAEIKAYTYLSTSSSYIDMYKTTKITLEKNRKKEIGKTVKWSASNSKVKITKKAKNYCKVYAKSAGTCTIKCKTKGKTLRIKIYINKVKSKNSKITYYTFSNICQGMTMDDVTAILGYNKTVYSSRTHTQAEYNDYAEYEQESPGEWTDYLWMEQTEYSWTDGFNTIYVTFNDGLVNSKTYM